MRNIYTTHYFIFFLLLSCFPLSICAQQNNVWIFGDHAGIDFNSGSAVPFYNPAIDAYEGTAVACDMSGNVLFYTDGNIVWDRNDQVMANGTGLGGGSSSTSVLILQKPGDCSKYYLFTTEDHTENGDLFYSVIDMCLNNGYGDVVTGEKAVFLQTNMSEKLCVVRNSNNMDAWLITHELSNDKYDVYSITSAGINTVPSTYHVGTFFAYNSQAGYLKASASGTKLAVGVFWTNICEVTNFDPSTGVVSGPAINYGPSMTTTSNGLWYGLEFSPNEHYLYATRSGFDSYLAYLYQVDLVTGTATLLSSSTAFINYYYGALRLAPDGKIYMARSFTPYLGVINDPDSAGLACNYVDQDLLLDVNSACRLGLPLETITMPFNSITISLGSDTTACDPFTINLQPTCGMTYTWQDGSTDSSYAVSDSGTYWVTATNQCGTAADTIHVSSGIQGGSISGDTLICSGQSTTLMASLADSYLWSDGSSSQTITVSPTQTTQYWSVITTGSCTDTLFVTVNVQPPPKTFFILSPDTICLSNPPFLLTGGVPSGGVYYGTGVSNNYFYPAIAGIGVDTIYYIYTDAAGCSDSAFQELVVDACTGLSDINSDQCITVSPTITEDKITITSACPSNQVTDIVLVNPVGKTVIQLPVVNKQAAFYNISLSAMPSGIYYLIVYGKKTSVVKVFKK